MAAEITIKRNDIGKVLSGQFLDANGNPPNLSGYTSAKVWMRERGSNVLKINGATFTFSDAALSLWQYTCTAADVNTSGRYKLEFEVVKAGVTTTFPTNETRPYLEVLIQDDLG